MPPAGDSLIVDGLEAARVRICCSSACTCSTIMQGMPLEIDISGTGVQQLQLRERMDQDPVCIDNRARASMTGWISGPNPDVRLPVRILGLILWLHCSA